MCQLNKRDPFIKEKELAHLKYSTKIAKIVEKYAKKPKKVQKSAKKLLTSWGVRCIMEV